MAKHNGGVIVLILLTVAVYVGTLVINSMAGPGGNGLFHNSTGAVSAYYFTEVTPAGWTFAVIWPVIYTYQAVWLVYILSTICRRSAYGYLYMDPGHIPVSLYPAFIVNNITNILWLILWDRFLPQYALISLTISALSLYFGLLFSYMKLYSVGNALIQEKRGTEIWLTRILVQNGLAFYATWVTLATIINLVVVLTYMLNMDQTAAAAVGYCILIFLLAAWYFIDMSVCDVYVRYTFTPYVVIILAMIGSISKKWDAGATSSIITAFILVITSLGLVIKIFVTRWRHNYRTIFHVSSLYSASNSFGTAEYEPLSGN